MATIAEYLDRAHLKRDLGELAELPLEALHGVSAEDAVLLDKALGVRTIRQLAEHPLVRVAQAITLLAEGRPPAEGTVELQYRRRLRELGLVLQHEPNGAPPPEADRTPIEVQGPPLSEQILEERR